ncbi:acyltransferase [Tolypothrix campylonemoides VB511288]|nr:acyltransferase [Tolypothrix campylonemoides VB511288]
MQRHYFLDWVRIGAFALLVLYHVGMYYVTWDWHVKSPFAGPALEPLMLASAPWRLSLLFFVSGVATAFLLGKGADGFLRRRSWRLLVPLVFGMLVVVPPQSYYEVVETLPGGDHDGYLAFWGRYLRGDDGFCRGGECPDMPTWNHLWFVAYLWVYTVVLCGLRWTLRGALDRGASHVVRALSGAGLLLWPAAALIAARIALVGRFESTHALVDDWYNHAQYLPIFLMGYAVARAQAVWTRFAALRWPAAMVSVACYAFTAWYFAAFADGAPPPTDALRLLQRAAWGAFQWSAIVAIVGFAARIAPGDGPARRYLTEAVFPVYILHQTLIIVLAERLEPLGLRPAVEGPLLVLGTLALCVAGFELVRRVDVLRPLFGLGPRARSTVAARAPEPT